MEQDFLQEPDADYLKGFNEGYLLQEQMPRFAETVARSLENISSDRANGFKAGSKQYDIEREQVLRIPRLEPDKEGYDEIIPEQDMNKDDIAPDKE